MDAAFGWEPPADTSITSDPARNSGLPSAATRPSGWVVDFGPVRGCSRESTEPSGAIAYPSKKFVLLGLVVSTAPVAIHRAAAPDPLRIRNSGVAQVAGRFPRLPEN